MLSRANLIEGYPEDILPHRHWSNLCSLKEVYKNLINVKKILKLFYIPSRHFLFTRSNSVTLRADRINLQPALANT